MSRAPLDMSIIIVSYNTRTLTLACLDSLRDASGNPEVWVVDNASSDDTVACIQKAFPDVHLIINDTNRGFAAANNQALPLCNGRYVVYLNPDTEVKPNALEKALSFMDSSPDVGLAGAKIQNPDGSLQPSVSYRYPSERFTRGETDGLAGCIACVLGAFMIARKDLLCSIGGFDEDFFLYAEDQDLCWRIRHKGLCIGFIPDAEVLHWGGQSEQSTPSPAVYEKKLRAEYLFYAKHYRAETITRIKRSQARKARYRLLTLRLTAPLARDPKAHADKTAGYEIALRLAKP